MNRRTVECPHSKISHHPKHDQPQPELNTSPDEDDVQSSAPVPEPPISVTFAESINFNSIA